MQEKEIIKLGYLGNEKHQSTLVISKEGIAPTLVCCMGGNLQVKIMDEVKVVGELEKGFKQVYQVLSPEGLSPTLDCCGGGNRQVKIYDEYEYRIRRLTPKEYGRLMGVSDEDYEKMASVNSNSQLYKQFGNSIVVDVMVAIFEKLNIEQEKEKND